MTEVRFEDHGVVFVRVENIEEGQRQRRGPFQWLDEPRALRGQEAGLWKIIDGLSQDQEGNVGQGRPQTPAALRELFREWIELGGGL